MSYAGTVTTCKVLTCEIVTGTLYFGNHQLFSIRVFGQQQKQSGWKRYNSDYLVSCFYRASLHRAGRQAGFVLGSAEPARVSGCRVDVLFPPKRGGRG